MNSVKSFRVNLLEANNEKRKFRQPIEIPTSLFIEQWRYCLCWRSGTRFEISKDETKRWYMKTLRVYKPSVYHIIRHIEKNRKEFNILEINEIYILFDTVKCLHIDCSNNLDLNIRMFHQIHLPVTKKHKLVLEKSIS